MELRAYWGTFLVHVAALLAAVHPVGADGAGWHRHATDRDRQQDRHPPVRLFVVSKLAANASLSNLVLDHRSLDPGERPCPQSGPVEADAIQLRDRGRDQLDWMPSVGENSALCALIDAQGRVAAAYVSKTGGDALEDERLLRSVRQMRFVPARRGGRPIGTWHRLIVNKPLGVPVETPPRGPDLMVDSRFGYTL